MRNYVLHVLIALACVVAIVGAVHAQIDSKTLEAASVPIEIPPDAHNQKNPVPATPESVAAGKLLFNSQCAMCHGPKGDGKGDLAETLKLRVPSFRDAKVQAARTDGDLFYVLTIGHGDMPGEGEDRLSADTRWNIVNYLRTLSK